jgi:ferredoxin-fold anticodon binding domain-containing protein
LCAALNKQGARYVVVGGMAVIHHGLLRATEDIDLLLERSRENQAKVFAALEVLSDKAVREIKETDLDQYTVVRVADEIVVDLMLSACGVTYEDAVDQIELRTRRSDDSISIRETSPSYETNLPRQRCHGLQVPRK